MTVTAAVTASGPIAVAAMPIPLPDVMAGCEALAGAGQPEAALRIWAWLRQSPAEQSAGSSAPWLRPAALLIRLRRFTEAAALLRDAQTVFPEDLTIVWEAAKLADLTGDWTMALARWMALRDGFPDHWAGYGGAARALLHLRRQEEADAVLREAARRFPDEVGLLPDLARVAEGRRDWAEALGHWSALQARRPDRPEGPLRAAKCLARLAQFDAAERLLLDGAARFPQERWFAFDYAQLAESNHDYETAIARWTQARALWPEAWQPYGGLSNCLGRLKRYAAAQDLLIEGLDRLPDEPGPLTGLADLAGRMDPAQIRLPPAALQARLTAFMRRHGQSPALLAAHARLTAVGQDWKGYHDELAAALARFPSDTLLANLFAGARELHLAEPRADPPADPPAELPADTGETPAIGAMLAHFESLSGGRIDGYMRGYGCEFGLIQRDAGVEPLGLLRWGTIAPDNLIRLLEARLEGLGAEANLRMLLTNEDEWAFLDRAYDMHCGHTNMFGATMPEAEARRKVAARQRFLARKLLDDLQEARKIFVYRLLGAPLDDDRLDRLAAALRRYGPNTLLYIRAADAGEAPFTVRWVRPGLMLGHIDWFRDGEHHHAANVSGWRRVCGAAFRLWRQRPADHPPAPPPGSTTDVVPIAG